MQNFTKNSFLLNSNLVGGLINRLTSEPMKELDRIDGKVTQWVELQEFSMLEAKLRIADGNTLLMLRQSNNKEEYPHLSLFCKYIDQGIIIYDSHLSDCEYDEVPYNRSGKMRKVKMSFNFYNIESFIQILYSGLFKANLEAEFEILWESKADLVYALFSSFLNGFQADKRVRAIISAGKVIESSRQS